MDVADENRIFKNVSFNKRDPYEMRLFKHADSQGMFAKYVKRLIQRDMEGAQPLVMQAAPVAAVKPTYIPPTPEPIQIETPPVFQQEAPEETPESMLSYL